MIHMEGVGRLVSTLANGEGTNVASATNTVLVHCLAGTRVWVKCREENPVTCRVYAGYEGAEEAMNTFSGVLLDEN